MKIPKADHPRIIERYRNGEKVTSICLSYGCNRISIYRILRRANVKADRKMMWEHVVERYQAGEALHKMVVDLKTSRQYIYRILGERGIPRRGRPKIAGPQLATPVRHEISLQGLPAGVTASVRVMDTIREPSKRMLMTGRAPRLPITLKGFPPLLGKTEGEAA
jgi:hypothetical protein